MPESTLLIPFDKELARSAYLEFNEGAEEKFSDGGGRTIVRPRKDRVEFQFPPKVLSDNRKGTWDETDYRGVAPIAIYASSQPRNITLQLTYICDGEWTWDKIKKNITLIRGYFQRIVDINGKQKGAGDQRNFVIRLKLWAIGGDQPMTFRMRSCDVKYSETMIGDTGTNTVSSGRFSYASKAYPLRTDITIDLSSFTQESNLIPQLEKTLTPDWY